MCTISFLGLEMGLFVTVGEQTDGAIPESESSPLAPISASWSRAEPLKST